MPRRTRTSWTAALVIAALAMAVRAAAQDDAATRTLFRVAYAAAQAGSGSPAASDSAALRAYPLYPYLQAARLEQSLSADAAIGAFLDEHGDAPYTARLRRSWLEDLARRGRWESYLTRYRGDDDEGATLRCHALAARVALGRNAGLEPAIVEQWLTPRSLPDACDPAIDWLRRRDALTTDLVERRARMALEAGEWQLARYLAKSLPSSVAAPLLQWAALLERPERSIDELIEDPAREVESAALLAGWSVLARRDPDASVARFRALIRARNLDTREASRYALATALGLAWSRRPGALEYFSLVQAEDFDDVAHEWHVRAAIWVGDWARAAQAIAAMPETLRNQNRWRYWAARATEVAGEDEAARAEYAGVVPSDNWYAALAAARLGKRFVPSLRQIQLDQSEIDRLARVPAFVRVRELLLCDLTSEASTEWRVAYETLTLSQQVQAIGLADRWGWHYQAIAAAARQTLFNDYPLLYPRPYEAQVSAAARLTKLPSELIYAVIRQESLYRPDAGSSAGALGLMQLLPSTARRAARRWGLKAPDRAELLQPGVNIPIGAGELRSLLDRFDGQTLLATAAYNAGPGAVRRWLPDSTIENDVWVENIPFNETRAYVQRVAWHSLVFAWLDDRKPRDTASWLGELYLPAPDAALKPSGG